MIAALASRKTPRIRGIRVPCPLEIREIREIRVP